MSVAKKTVKLISEDDNIGLFTFEVSEEFLKVVLEDGFRLSRVRAFLKSVYLRTVF